MLSLSLAFSAIPASIYVIRLKRISARRRQFRERDREGKKAKVEKLAGAGRWALRNEGLSFFLKAVQLFNLWLCSFVSWARLGTCFGLVLAKAFSSKSAASSSAIQSSSSLRQLPFIKSFALIYL